MRTLLINLTRFGDLLQSQPLVHELADAGHAVGVVCLDNFVEPARLLSDVSAVFPFEGAKCLAGLDKNWRGTLGHLQNWCNEVIQSFRPDCVINLTSTPAGRLLARRLGQGARLRGFGVDANGFGANNTLWTGFFEAASRRRGCSPFNLVDLFRKSAGCGGFAPRNALQVPELPEWPHACQRLGLPQQPARLVAFQLGASETRRQWPIGSFVRLGRGLAAAGYTPVLVGSVNEKALAEAYAAEAKHPFVDCVGDTSLRELAMVLRASSLLVTNDTGTMHLAAGLGVPCIALFLATAQPWDTGPYRADCLCLEPDLPCHPCGFGTTCPHNELCRGTVQPDTVLGLALLRLRGVKDFAAALGKADFQGARVWQTIFTREGFDLFADLRSLSGHESTERTAWLRLQRHYYRQFLDCCDSGAGAEADSLFVAAASPELAAAIGPEARQELIASLAQSLAVLQLIEQLGELLLQGTSSSQIGQRFLSAVHRLASLFEATPHFDALGRLWLASVQERGDDLPVVLRMAATLRRHLESWRDCLEAVTIS